MENRLVKNLNKKGQILTAKRLFYQTLLAVKNTHKRLPIAPFLAQSLASAQPRITFKNKKVSGNVHRIPFPYPHLDRVGLAARWAVHASRHVRNGMPAHQKLSQELLDMGLGRGESWKKKKEFHRLALANKANLKYM